MSIAADERVDLRREFGRRQRTARYDHDPDGWNHGRFIAYEFQIRQRGEARFDERRELLAIDRERAAGRHGRFAR
jgi:hypothetical protein